MVFYQLQSGSTKEVFGLDRGLEKDIKSKAMEKFSKVNSKMVISF